MAESSLPVSGGLALADLPGGRGASYVAMRLHEGEEASCLNLARAQQPRLLGVEASDLSRRGAFTFVEALGGGRGSWTILDGAGEDIPAVADENTMWSLGKKLGDRIEYTDSRGRRIGVRLAGVIANSVLQGSVVVSAARLAASFPADGKRFFLIDTAAGDDEVGRLATALSRQFSGSGISIERASERVARLDAVEDSYLDIFTLLGGLGMVLGCVGLAAMTVGSVIERRGELAVMSAAGFGPWRIRGLVMLEHAWLLAAGLAAGLVAAGVAAAPVVARGVADLPAGSLAAMLALAAAVGLVSAAAASWAALRGPLVGAAIGVGCQDDEIGMDHSGGAGGCGGGRSLLLPWDGQRHPGGDARADGRHCGRRGAVGLRAGGEGGAGFQQVHGGRGQGV